ncbi:5'-deoxynucleotidase [Vibrio coralliirubri]|uniref:5'-deoxynucleotidase n=1 Tax=Vibrio coralliirubri TaxID=1516159 RepID=UPI0022840E6C|nr:5'-deoxynucleotidase [Vibrio coralliirubri]MCY9861341.1 5'-deoxynucleotidase [Vibrio coralliirubri]
MIKVKYSFLPNSLFALLRRTRFINRWSLMFNLAKENVSEHSHEVSIFSHAIAVIGIHNYQRSYNAERIATIAIYHELSESILGDQPSTLKHATDETTAFFKGIESQVETGIVNTLPSSIRDHIASVTLASHFTKQEKDIVKAGDLLSMLIKCEHEISLNNREFLNARSKIFDKLGWYFETYPEVKEFYEVHMSQCKLTIDGLVNL